MPFPSPPVPVFLLSSLCLVNVLLLQDESGEMETLCSQGGSTLCLQESPAGAQLLTPPRQLLRDGGLGGGGGGGDRSAQ